MSQKSHADLSGFQTLYRAHFAFAWRALARLGVPDRDLMVVYRKVAQFDPATRATTWIYAICMRVASDRRRSARARYEVLTEPDALQWALADADAADVLSAQRRAWLRAALDALPIEQRAVFTLFELEGMTGDEIAELLAVPVSTVHSRLRLARVTVRRVLGRERAREEFGLARTRVRA